jgi:hypothetical protein
MRTDGHYAIGTLTRVVAVTSAFQRTALTQIADGENPFAHVSPTVHEELRTFFHLLYEKGLLNRTSAEVALPHRYQMQPSASDIAIKQFRARSAPELAQTEWIDQVGDGGTSTLSSRSNSCIELSGRSRVITLLYSILLASGISHIRFADRHFKPLVSDLDIGFGAITATDLGANYYDVLDSHRRELSLFPLENKSQLGRENIKPALVIHYGECDPELLIEWSQRGIPHLLIHPHVGDEIVIGPLVVAGESPCNRCLSLYELDNFGFRTDQMIPLTPLEDLPTVAAYSVAAIVASQSLHFIDQLRSGADSSVIRNTGVGEITLLNFQRLTEPQVVAISRHPLCGCDQ